MLRNSLALLAPLVLLCPTPGHAEPSRPSNYDECILDALRGVSSDVAARAIIESCRNLFPETQGAAAPPAAPPAPLDTTAARGLTADELARLGVKGRMFGSTYNVIVENHNPGLTLTEVTIAVWDDADATASRKEYSEAAQIPPRTSGKVKYTVHYRGSETDWRWGVVGARGVE